ncbi:MAG: metallophosphoesterase [Lachnospiraceae bacterium]|nr:metallophosphoesterase [Lachnospiraceae bacterium]
MRKRPVITEYRYYADIPEKIRIVQLTDLHSCPYGKEGRYLLDAVKEAGPDLIFITGDMFNKLEPDNSEVLDIISRLPSIAPVFYSLGNHEMSYKRLFKEEYKQFLESLKKAGICLLDDETTLIQVKGTKLEIGGFTGDREGYARFVKTKIYKKMLAPGTKGPIRLLLSHNPEFYRSYELSDWDVIFCGHLHGGVVRIPFFRGLVSPSGRLFPKYSKGYFQLKNGKKMVVSAGLGMHTIKIRIFNPPELCLLTVGK